VTWKDLQKLIGQNQQSQQYSKEFERFLGKPFWIWDKIEHNKEYVTSNGTCCFQHVIGLPTKDNVEKPLFDYQQLIYNTLETNKHLWILKSTGLGITELFLRYMCYLALHDDTYQNSQFVLVTGPNWDLSKKLIGRMKKLFEPLNIYFDSKETVIELNKCTIESFPSHHVDSFRSLDNPKFILLDECDFFSKGQQEDVRAVAERYIAKSNPYIVLVSTPNAPGGLMESIEQEPESTCLYKRIKLDYLYGMDKIYSQEDIEKAKQSPSFEREYNLKYLGKIGNVFSLQDIEKAIQLGETYKNLEINPYALHIGGCDFGFSSSVTALYVGEVDTENQIIRMVIGEEYDKTTPSIIADRMFKLHTEIPNLLWFVDGANRGATNEVKSKFGESLEWSKLEDINIEDNYVIPVTFQKDHKSMLEWTYQLLSKQKIAIPSKYDKLILSLKTAYASDFSLDKERTVHSDSLDALRLLLKGVKFRTSD